MISLNNIDIVLDNSELIDLVLDNNAVIEQMTPAQPLCADCTDTFLFIDPQYNYLTTKSMNYIITKNGLPLQYH